MGGRYARRQARQEVQGEINLNPQRTERKLIRTATNKDVILE